MLSMADVCSPVSDGADKERAGPVNLFKSWGTCERHSYPALIILLLLLVPQAQVAQWAEKWDLGSSSSRSGRKLVPQMTMTPEWEEVYLFSN